MAHPDAELIITGYEAFQKQDVETLRGLFHEDIEWSSKGGTPLSGLFRGPQAVLEMFGRIPQLTDHFELELHDVLANDDHVVVMARQHVARAGKRHDGMVVHVYHLEDGKVRQAFLIQEDPEAWEALWQD